MLWTPSTPLGTVKPCPGQFTGQHLEVLHAKMALLVSGASAYALPASQPPCGGTAHTLMSAAFIQGLAIDVYL